MITKAGLGLLSAVVLCFGGGFLGTVATRSQPTTAPAQTKSSPVARWLGLGQEEAKTLEDYDPQFAEDLETLRKQLDNARSALAAEFENEDATDEEIRGLVEVTIEAHNRLERRVAGYLIEVRRHLTPCQQKRLFGLAAKQVRKCCRRCRGTQGADFTPVDGRPCSQKERGKGKGPRRGPGRRGNSQ